MLTHQYVYAYGAVSILQGNFDSLVLPHFSAARYRNENIMMVLGGAGGYKNQSMLIPGNICLLSLPPYSPKLNPVEHLWGELHEKCFHNREHAIDL
jgi:DDE superfamily endonuclease